MKQLKLKRGFGFNTVNYAFFAVLSVVMVYPIWHQVCLSFSSSDLAKSGGFFLIPRGFELTGYSIVLSSRYIWTAFGNSLFITVMSVFLGVFICCGMAYLLSKKEVPGVKVIMGFVLFAYLFSGGIIPTYIVVKETGIMNTLWALIIPGIFAPFNVIIIRNFFQSLPSALEESAIMDGAGYFTIFTRIILPLSTPILATVSIWVAVAHWNGYMSALLYIRDKTKYILPLLIRDIVMGASDMANIEVNSMASSDIINAATIIIATIPIMIVYPFLQKYFTKGIMLGAVKG